MCRDRGRQGRRTDRFCEMSSLPVAPRVPSWRARHSLRLVNATELLASLAALPGVRRSSTSQPLQEAVVVSGIEVGTTSATDERALRQAWQKRHGGGAMPLILVADEAEGVVRVLGPSDGTDPVRSVETSALRDLLGSVVSLRGLDAVREVAAELERVDLAGVPGIKVRDLLTMYTLTDRLGANAERWQVLKDAANSVSPTAAGWQEVVKSLGYSVERLPRYGSVLRHQDRPVAVVHPKASASELSRLDADGRPPEGLLLRDCKEHGAPFGIMVAGLRFRLFSTDPGAGAAAARFVEIDAALLKPDDRPFLGLLAPAFLAEGGFQQVVVESRQFGAKLRERLDETIRQQVLPTLARVLGTWATRQHLDVTEQAVREELERAALTLVFRALFILYAEGARYLPVDHPAYSTRSLTHLVEEATQLHDELDAHSTRLWSDFAALISALRSGDRARRIAAYNGSLFATDGFEGAQTLERLQVADPDFGEVLIGLGRDATTGAGVDYSTLEIGHLGHIYEGLLSLRLSVADKPLRYDRRRDTYVAAAAKEADVASGELLWQTHEGGRKGGGVYYTRAELVRHLVTEAVVPRFERHLADVAGLAEGDPSAAAERLFDFAVLDPACGSAHFLVMVVDELADRVVRFLADRPLPKVAQALASLQAGAMQGTMVEDVVLLRRLVLKHCVFGVDLSPMGAEIAKLSLWLASFVPGLSLAYLERNVQVGNSLVGVARPEAVIGSEASLFEPKLRAMIERAATAARMVAETDDATPDDVKRSREADAKARKETEELSQTFDLWTAEPFGVAGARDAIAVYVHGGKPAGFAKLLERSHTLADEHRFFHWSLAFPTVFDRENPGFDAVVGNPPWEEVTIEELAFYALFRPGLRALPEKDRRAAIADLVAQRPELPARLAEEQERKEDEREFLKHAEYRQMPGDPDLYKFFCQRYGMLLRNGGALGVVLPRTTFITQGSAEFRTWLFEQNTTERLDFLLNRRCWIFKTHPQYTIALVSARREPAKRTHRVRVAGTAEDLAQWELQTAAAGLALPPEAFGPHWMVPLLRNQREADLLAKLRLGSPFSQGPGGDRWRCFPVAELHETNDRALWERARSGWPLWKGESFDQYDPNGHEARRCPTNPAVWKKVRKPRPGAESVIAEDVSLAERRQAVVDEIGRARLAFRDVTRATDSRTVRACLVPPETFLTNKAPYLAFARGDDGARAACLGVMNSLPFDWQARRFVETNLNFFILEGLIVPELSDADYEAVSRSAARLSCVDERYADFAESAGVALGALGDYEHQELRADIDVRVARAWGMTSDDLDTLFGDFTLDAVSASYRDDVRTRLAKLPH